MFLFSSRRLADQVVRSAVETACHYLLRLCPDRFSATGFNHCPPLVFRILNTTQVGKIRNGRVIYHLGLNRINGWRGDLDGPRIQVDVQVQRNRKGDFPVFCLNLGFLDNLNHNFILVTNVTAEELLDGVDRMFTRWPWRPGSK